MKQLVRENAAYIFAILVGAVLVPLLMVANAWEVVANHTFKTAFVGSILAIIAMLQLLKTDIPRRSNWAILEIVIVLGALPVAYVSGTVLYESGSAWQGEGTHWHADFAVVVDGESYGLIDPHNFCNEDYVCRFANHTGVTHIHEHGDQRIHIEGVVQTRDDATLAAFFDAVGGELTDTTIRYPTNDGWINRTTDEEGSLKVLVQRGEEQNRAWEHIEQPADYVISPHNDGPVDKIFFIYDETPISDALEDVREDDRYRGNAIG